MIFNHLKYLKPIWYFNLKSQKDYCYFPTKLQLQKAGISLDYDLNYKSETAQLHDLGWTAFQSGFISKVPENGVSTPVPIGVHKCPSKSKLDVKLIVLSAKLSPPITS